MIKNKLIFVFLAAGVVLGGTVAVAASRFGETYHTSVLASGKALEKHLSIAEAGEIATAEVTGKITKTEKIFEHGSLKYKYEIETSKGESHVRVDAQTGRILLIKHDD